VLEALINGRYCWVPFSALTKITIEEPADLRDMVWSAAQLEFTNGGQSVALIPTRYPGTATEGDALAQLARRTEWQALNDEHFRGIGQRVLALGEHDSDLLAVREITLEPLPVPDDEPTPDIAA
jgi:type VI secretion system protein ImpE